jgi:hypothetical protein
MAMSVQGQVRRFSHIRATSAKPPIATARADIHSDGACS